MREKRLAGVSETQEQMRGVDLAERVPSIGTEGAVAMRFVCIRGMIRFESWPFGFFVPRRDVLMGGLAVYELAVLGAVGVLDEKHVAAARALQK